MEDKRIYQYYQANAYKGVEDILNVFSYATSRIAEEIGWYDDEGEIDKIKAECKPRLQQLAQGITTLTNLLDIVTSAIPNPDDNQEAFDRFYDAEEKCEAQEKYHIDGVEDRLHPRAFAALHSQKEKDDIDDWCTRFYDLQERFNIKPKTTEDEEDPDNE